MAAPGGGVNRILLEDLAEELGVDVIFLEKDFVLTEIIRHYAVGPLGEHLVLKGGQALRHIYGSVRLSKDIDYVARKRLEFDELREALAIRYPRLRLPAAPIGHTRHGLKVRPIHYRGPLARDDSVELEVSFRDDLVLEPEARLYTSPFSAPFHVLVLQLSEIVAEKIRALYQRGNPRDLYDLWFILANAELAIDEASIVSMLPLKFRPPLVAGGWNRARLYLRIEEEAHTWDGALGALAPGYPPYDEALALVQQRLRFLSR